MSDPALPVIRIAAAAASGELAAWRQVGDLLADAFHAHYRFELTAHATPEAALADGAPIVGLSLLAELSRQTDLPAVEAQWEAICSAIPTGRVVFVSTILRYLPEATQDAMARLRRLNLLAVRLSQRFGLLVIDIDRMLAHHGAMALQTDAHLSGPQGQEAAARVMAGAALCYGLNGLVDDDALDQAISVYEASAGGAIDRLTVGLDRSGLKPSKIGVRVQRHIAHEAEFEGRSGWGLLRDLRHGRVAVDVAAVEIARKLRVQLQSKSRSLFGRIAR